MTSFTFAGVIAFAAMVLFSGVVFKLCRFFALELADDGLDADALHADARPDRIDVVALAGHGTLVLRPGSRTMFTIFSAPSYISGISISKSFRRT